MSTVFDTTPSDTPPSDTTLSDVTRFDVTRSDVTPSTRAPSTRAPSTKARSEVAPSGGRQVGDPALVATWAAPADTTPFQIAAMEAASALASSAHSGSLFEIPAATVPGARAVAMAERFAARFAAGAAAHDPPGTFAHEHVDALRRAGFLGMPVPRLFGGQGVLSARDVLVAASRLARGDAATAIGVNMHLAVTMNLVRMWRVAGVRGDEERARALVDPLRGVASGQIVFAAAVSEPAQDLSRPATTATRSERGWIVRGTKSFCTMAPAATVLNVAVTATDGPGSDRYAFVAVPAHLPGVEVHDDWDALGMRASGSHSVTFHDVVLPADAVSGGFPLGEWSGELLERYLVSGAFHAAASLGIAEAAHDTVVASLRGRPLVGPTASHTTMVLAQNLVELSTMQATFERAAAAIDHHHESFPAGDAPPAVASAVFARVQMAKAHVGDAAVRVVDRAMALTGGAGFRRGHPLARAYRDVRAGAFMHPIGANRVHDFLARTELGLQLLPG